MLIRNLIMEVVRYIRFFFLNCDSFRFHCMIFYLSIFMVSFVVSLFFEGLSHNKNPSNEIVNKNQIDKQSKVMKQQIFKEISNYF